jgi:hypothetical protein
MTTVQSFSLQSESTLSTACQWRGYHILKCYLQQPELSEEVHFCYLIFVHRLAASYGPKDKTGN